MGSTELARNQTCEDQREALAAKLESEIGPLINLDKSAGGYDCCGCSTYEDILDHAIRIVREFGRDG